MAKKDAQKKEVKKPIKRKATSTEKEAKKAPKKNTEGEDQYNEENEEFRNAMSSYRELHHVLHQRFKERPFTIGQIKDAWHMEHDKVVEFVNVMVMFGFLKAAKSQGYFGVVIKKAERADLLNGYLKQSIIMQEEFGTRIRMIGQVIKFDLPKDPEIKVHIISKGDA